MYLGHRLLDQRAVAVKVLHDSVDRHRFDREAAVLSEIDHPSIIQLLDFGQLPNGALYLVTSRAEGQTLSDRLEADGPLGVAEVRRVAIQLSEALDALHHRGIVHRDLSLANILLTNDHRVTLIDFGFARSADAATVTASGDLVGTTRYLAPELLDGATPSPASDQYAAAVITYELLAGVWPFEATDTVGRTFHHHLSSAPIPLRERVGDAPASLESAIERALSKDPTHRFGSMRDFADAALSGRSTPHRRPSRAAAVGVGAVALLAAGALAVNWSGVLDRDDDRNDEATSSPISATSEDTPASGSWPAGLAGELECNLLDTPGFETNALPPNFWLDPSNPDPDSIARLVPDSGVGGSAAVAIGRNDAFGAFGTIVSVRANTEYVFAASVSLTDRPFEAEMSIAWLDADFQLIDGDTVAVDLITAAPGRAQLVVPVAPAGAEYAVTRLAKDASAGVLIVDEVVFAERGSPCDGLAGVGQ